MFLFEDDVVIGLVGLLVVLHELGEGVGAPDEVRVLRVYVPQFDFDQLSYHFVSRNQALVQHLLHHTEYLLFQSPETTSSPLYRSISGMFIIF
jgi:hypothetical protein